MNTGPMLYRVVAREAAPPEVRPRLEDRMSGSTTWARIFDRFLTTCRERPRATAIVHAGGAWTHDQLERASRALATQLLAQPAEGGVVALFARRSPELVLGMLACLRAGLTFAVLDAAYPPERLEQLLAVARPGRLITCAPTRDDEAVLARLRLPDVVVHLDEAAVAALLRSDAPAGGGLDAASPAEIAYLLFTSGTTGVPKCIKTAHSPLVHFIDWYARAFSVDAGCRFSMLSGLGHDPVLRDVFVPLSLGAELHIPPPASLLDPPKLYRWLLDTGVTHVHLTPQLGRLVCAGRRDRRPLEKLRFIFSGGDVLRRKQAIEMMAVAPTARVVNFYGATETPQAMAHHVFDPVADDALEIVPIGRGIDDVQLLVLDDELRLTDVGARGQIAIRTRFLSAGYLHDAGLTREKFVPHPGGLDPSDLLYLTGDVGYFRSDGAVVAQGRRDDQVKIRGFRVELGEVVHHLLRLAAVSAAVVLPEQAPDGENRLIAYLIGHEGATGGPAESAAVKSALAASLPAYMVPFQCVWIPAFPLLPNGKIDRAGLPSFNAGDEAVEPSQVGNPIEAAIASQWTALLGFPSVDLDRSFIDLGGDSLSFINAAMQLEEVLGALPERWETLSIRELAREKRATRSLLTRIDSTVLLRAISIVAIVAAHLGFPNLAGSVRTLFVVSGMSFGKYLVTSVMATNRVSAILRLALKIALPTALYTVALDLAFFQFRWQALFLLNNFIGPKLEEGGFSFWFVCVLVQSQLALAALLALGPARELVRKNPFGFPLVSSLLFAGIALVAPHFWDTSRFNDWMPHLYIGSMFLGWAAVQADSPRRRLLVVAATVATFAEPAWHSHEPLILPFAATFFLTYQRQIRLPVALGKLVNLVAGASLFTYLIDFQVKSFVDKTPLRGYPLLTLGIAVATGIVLWKVWEASFARLMRWYRGAPRSVAS
jgi:amino acid adenylation domain-containing protein